MVFPEDYYERDEKELDDMVINYPFGYFYLDRRIAIFFSLIDYQFVSSEMALTLLTLQSKLSHD